MRKWRKWNNRMNNGIIVEIGLCWRCHIIWRYTYTTILKCYIVSCYFRAIVTVAVYMAFIKTRKKYRPRNTPNVHENIPYIPCIPYIYIPCIYFCRHFCTLSQSTFSSSRDYFSSWTHFKKIIIIICRIRNRCRLLA